LLDIGLMPHEARLVRVLTIQRKIIKRKAILRRAERGPLRARAVLAG